MACVMVPPIEVDKSILQKNILGESFGGWGKSLKYLRHFKDLRIIIL